MDRGVIAQLLFEYPLFAGFSLICNYVSLSYRLLSFRSSVPLLPKLYSHKKWMGFASLKTNGFKQGNHPLARQSFAPY
jgi:hypothetical protein